MNSNHAASSVVFKVLGPLEVVTQPGTPDLCGKPAKLLALLLLNANSWVAASQIPDALWSDTPPASADRNVKTYIWQLRRALPTAADGSVRVEGKRGGYRIRVAPDELDASVLEDVARYGADADPADAAARLQAALDLWRGTPYAELPEETTRLSVARLEQIRWQVREHLADALMSGTRYLDAVALLQPLTTEDPLREGLWTRLVLALNGAGLRAEALASFQSARRVLIEELGVEPGPALQEAHRRALAGETSHDDLLAAAPPVGPTVNGADHAGRRRVVAAPVEVVSTAVGPARSGSASLPADTVPAVASAGRGVETSRPAQTLPPFEQVTPSFLPRDIPDFVGRDAEIAAVGAGDAANDLSPIAVVEGMPGVGKTALAVHIAHRLRGDFPDGQVFCDLHGHDPDAPPAEPVDLLAGLLQAFGVPPEAIPDGLERRAALWRSVLTGRRVLLVLDDAVSTAQVGPLLPSYGSCLVLVTSRRRLSELDGVQLVRVDPMPDADALALLTGRRGQPSSPQQAAANLSIVQRCGNLPAAIRVAASRLQQHPYWDPSTMADRLEPFGSRLAELRTGDRDVAALLATSYAQLTATGQQLFRAIATSASSYPSDDGYATGGRDDGETWREVHVDEIGPLADLPAVEVERTLEHLLDHHLVTQFPHDRYGMHVLLRQYGSRIAGESAPARRQSHVPARVTQTA